MSKKKQNLNFVTPNKDQQKIFQDYLGKKLGTKALLVLEQEIEDKQTSYNFIYQYPDQLQLASFLIVLDSEERLVSLASNIVTDASNAYAINIQDFILEYVKKSLGEETQEIFEIPYKNLEQNIPNTDKKLVKTVVNTVLEVLGKRELLEQIVQPKTSGISAADYSTKSQATYFFDCTNVGNLVEKTEDNKIIGYEISNLNTIKSKGSFCCILKKGTEYFILTAGHNLNSSNDNYKLIKDANNFVELELITDYRPTYDAAILKINKITEFGKINYCDKVYIRKVAEDQKKCYYKENTNEFYDIETRLKVEGNDIDFKLTTEKFSIIDEASFYGNAIKFGKDSLNDLTLIKDTDKIQIVSYISEISKSLTVKNLYSPGFSTEECQMKLLLNERYGTTGDSGGVGFRISDKKLIGIYLGNSDNNYATFRTVPKVTTIDNINKKTKIDNSSLAQNTNITDYEVC